MAEHKPPLTTTERTASQRRGQRQVRVVQALVGVVVGAFALGEVWALFGEVPDWGPLNAWATLGAGAVGAILGGLAGYCTPLWETASRWE